jgi:pimeloyl-ACP methyl ester carboxylesterase
MSLPATCAETVETALGPVELARAGAGPPVLFVHGTPGGWDSSVAMGRFLVEAGFEVLAPSRPGYPATPLHGRATIDDQADLHAALLDGIGCERAGVVTWSGGGPSGYRLAVRHPGRVRALIAFAAVSQRYREPRESPEDRLVMQTTAGNRLLRFLIDHAPRQTVSATLKAEGDLSEDELRKLVAEVFEDDRELDVVLTMARVAGDYRNRRAGIENDWLQFGGIDSLELEKIGTPTLVINGTADIDVPPPHSEHAAETIPGAERLIMDRGTHLCLFVHPDAHIAQARAAAFLGARTRHRCDDPARASKSEEARA